MKIKIPLFLSKKEKPSLLELLLDDPPLTLILGTVPVSSKKDVIAYARGIAESQLIAKESSYIDAIKVDGRWIYEIHEGGAAYSLARWVVSQLGFHDEESIAVPLAGSRVAHISVVDGEIATIIYPPDENRCQETILNLLGHSELKEHKLHKLHPFYGNGKEYVKAGAALLGMSLVVLAASASIYWKNASEFSAQKIALQMASSGKPFVTKSTNIPLHQLKKAIHSIKKEDGFLAYLKFENGRWTFAEKSGS